MAGPAAYLSRLPAAQSRPCAWGPHRSFCELVSAGPRSYAPVISINNITLLALRSRLFPGQLLGTEHSCFYTLPTFYQLPGCKTTH